MSHVLRLALLVSLVAALLAGANPATAQQRGDARQPLVESPQAPSSDRPDVPSSSDRPDVPSSSDRPDVPSSADRPDVPPSLRAWVEGLEPAEQRIVMQRLRSMRPLQRRRFLRRWENASPAQLERLQARMEDGIARGIARQSARLEQRRAQRERRAEELGIDPQRLEENRRAWQSMGGDKQRRMRARLERFAELDASQQEAVVSFQFADRTDAERERILEKLREAAGRLAADGR